MASIHRNVIIERSAAEVWDAMRDVGALHTRLVAGFVVDTRLAGRVRDVTFANGMKAKETIIDIDEQRRRVVWTATGGNLTHYNASAQVFQVTDLSSEVRWIADLLPDEAASMIDAMIQQGLAAMKKTLEA